MAVHRIGFYRELRHGDPEGPSLRAAVRDAGPPEEEQLAAYLDGGVVLAASAGRLVDDVLDPARVGVAPMDMLTDGAWMWPADLGYYVRTYHLDLDPAFVDHVRSNGHQPPVLDDDALMEVVRQVRGD